MATGLKRPNELSRDGNGKFDQKVSKCFRKIWTWIFRDGPNKPGWIRTLKFGEILTRMKENCGVLHRVDSEYFDNAISYWNELVATFSETKILMKF